MKNERWMLAWARLLPLLLASKQWTLAAWLIHMDHICQLYEYYKASNKGSEHLGTYYEDRIRWHWHRQCEFGRVVDLEAEASNTNEKSWTSARHYWNQPYKPQD